MNDQGKKLEAIRKEAKRKGWRVERGNGYYKMWCPQPCGKHWKTVHLTPSDPNYTRNLLGQLRRATCWDKKEDQQAADQEGPQ